MGWDEMWVDRASKVKNNMALCMLCARTYYSTWWSEGRAFAHTPRDWMSFDAD
jgi:hypothetical protein